jgi:hypothetical protein
MMQVRNNLTLKPILVDFTIRRLGCLFMNSAVKGASMSLKGYAVSPNQYLPALHVAAKWKSALAGLAFPAGAKP